MPSSSTAAPAAGFMPAWFDTLQARLAAGAMAALLAGMALIGWHQARVAERELLAGAQARQHVEAQRTAAVISRRVAEMQRALRLTALQLDRATLADTRSLAAFYERQPVLRSMFASIFAARPDGTMLLLADAAGLRRPAVSIADREYFRRTVQEQRAQVSDPVPGRVSNEPVVVFTQPLVEGGQVWGVIGGSLRLASRDLLADLAEARDDDRDELVVVTDGQGSILAHPQRARLLQSLAQEPRLVQAHAQWAAERRPLLRDAGHWQQPGEVVAMAGEPEAGWHVWRVTASAELLLPLADARRQAALSAALMALPLALLLLLYLGWQLRPLSLLERHARALLDGNADAAGAWPRARGEMGRLARALEQAWTERARVQAQGAALQQRLMSVMAASPVGIAFTRFQKFELVSAEFCRLFRCSQDELVEHPAQKIYASNEDYLALGPLVGQAFAASGSYVGEWQMLRADGTRFWCRLHGRPVAAGDASAGTIWSLYDISDEVARRRGLEHAASHDPLTGMRNREHFERALNALFAAQPGALPAAVLMIDLDHFKPINDEFGHAAGDAMLKAVTVALTAQVRGSDIVARLGGDEFAVLLAGCERSRAVAVAEKMRAAVGSLVLTWSGHPLRVGASVGVAELGHAHGSAQAWLADADAACYAAKRDGRGGVRVAAFGAGPPGATLTLIEGGAVAHR